jgi:hypothetical protein
MRGKRPPFSRKSKPLETLFQPLLKRRERSPRLPDPYPEDPWRVRTGENARSGELKLHRLGRCRLGSKEPLDRGETIGLHPAQKLQRDMNPFGPDPTDAGELSAEPLLEIEDLPPEIRRKVGGDKEP